MPVMVVASLLLAYLAIIEKVRSMKKAGLLESETTNLPDPNAPPSGVTITTTVTPKSNT